MNESSQRVWPKRRYCLLLADRPKRWPRAYGRSQQAFQLANLASCAPRSNLQLDPTCGRRRAHSDFAARLDQLGLPNRGSATARIGTADTAPELSQGAKGGANIETHSLTL